MPCVRALRTNSKEKMARKTQSRITPLELSITDCEKNSR